MYRGFSTLEMLLAMTILVMCMSAVLLLSPGTQGMSVDSETAVEALRVATRMLEHTQALSRKDFKLVNPTTTLETIGPLTYTTAIEVLPMPDHYTKRVTAHVSWGAQYNRAQDVALTSLVSNFQNAIGGDTCSSVLTGNWGSPSISHVLLGGLSGMSDSAGAYPITAVDAHHKKLYVTVNQAAQATAATSPGTALSDPGSGVVWDSAANARVNDASNASSATTLNSTRVTNYLKASNFGFSIPTGATIVGIQVEVEKTRGSSGSGSIFDSQVRMIKADGTLAAQNKAQTSTAWPSTATYTSYTTDLWGEKWTPADINDPDFGVAISATGSTGGSRTANIDHVRISVTYVRSFYVLDITTPDAPTFDRGLGSNSVTTGFTDVAVAEGATTKFAFVSTNSDVRQLQIIDLQPTTPEVVATYQVPGIDDASANTIFYKDGYVYLGLEKSIDGPEFVIIDAHNPLALIAPIGTYAVDAGVKDIYVKNNYVFLATDDNARELVVLDVNDLAHPTLRGVYDAPGTTGFGYGTALYTVGDTLTMGRSYVSGAPEFAILDTATGAPTLLGTSDVGPNASSPYSINGLLVRDYLTFVLTGSPSAGGRLQILNTANPAALVTDATLTLPNTGSGVALDCEGNYLYAASVPLSGTFTNRGSISIITAP